MGKRVSKDLLVTITLSVDLQNFINIHFKSKQLGEQMLQHNRTSMLHFIYNPLVVCVLVSHDITNGEFVLQVPYYPPVESVDDYKNDLQRCLKIVNSAISNEVTY